MRLAEQQALAEVRDRRAVAQQLEVPRAVDRVAVEHGAADLVVLHDDLLVDAARRVLEHELLAVRAAREVAGREEIDARDLELRRGLRARVAADPELGEMIREHLRLLEERRDEPVARAAMLHAFAERVDPRVEGLHRVADEHAALAREAARFRERDVRPDPDRHHDEIGRDLGAVREAHGARTLLADDRLRLRRHLELEPALLERAPQEIAARGVELPLHQRRQQMHDGHVHAALLEPVRGLEAEQPAADHDRASMLARGRGCDHSFDVRDVAIRDDAGQVLARQRQHDGGRARREDQPVVRRLDARRRDHAPARAVDLHDLVACDQGDPTLRIPFARVQHDVRDGLLGREHGRQQDPVVVAVGLGAEHRYLVHVRLEGEQFFDRAHAGHAVADEDQLPLRFRGGRAAAEARPRLDGFSLRLAVKKSVHRSALR